MISESNFWNGLKNENGQQLTIDEQIKFCGDLELMISASPELAKIFFNTQVYNEIENGVTTRGAHSLGVATVAGELAYKKAILDGKTEQEADVSKILSKVLGYMHDLGHTPYGHDGEGALGLEMERFPATKDYKDKRIALYGQEYTDEAKDPSAKYMCYEHNETSSTIGSRMLQDFVDNYGYTIDEEALQYIKTGILAHSTSRVKTEPKGIEQKAVRLADKVAYIPQDLLDLLKQSVISIDDLTPSEIELLGMSEEEIETFKEYDKWDNERDKQDFLENLDANVSTMQAKIAEDCFIEKNGEIILDAQKATIDRIARYVNDGIAPNPKKNETPLSQDEMDAAELFRKMTYAQQNISGYENEQEVPANMDPDEQKEAIERSADSFSKFLQDKFKMKPIIATLWTTKAKYQDSFIAGDLKRTSKGQTEKLEDINDKKENQWKMKTTFQYFYSNIAQIPEDFRDKYSSGEYTDQQLVSAFIASFTNVGLKEIYDGLAQKGLIISRDKAIEMLKIARPDLDVDKIADKSMKFEVPFKDPDTSESSLREEKISANDILEQTFEENVHIPIVKGKNQDLEHAIPSIKQSDNVRAKVEKLVKKDKMIPEALSSVIDISETEVTDADIKMMVQSVRERQNTQEIQKHISDVEQGERG